MLENNFFHHFLIAMPNVEGPYFNQSVVYVFDHSDKGAAGLVINHATNITFGDLFLQLELDDSLCPQKRLPLLAGGPVQTDRGFVLHSDDRQWESTMPLEDGISLTTSKDILRDIAAGYGPSKSLMMLGYAGWEAGQLEDEISSNSWLTIRADKDILFNHPLEHRWRGAAKKLGIDVSLICNQSGHA